MMFQKDAVKQWRRTVHKELRRLRVPSSDPRVPQKDERHG